MKPKLFLFVAHLSGGGQERFVSRLSKMLCDEYDIYLLLLDSSDACYDAEGTVIPLKSGGFDKSGGLLTNIRKAVFRCTGLRKALREHKPVACISFGMGADLTNLLCKRRGTKMMTSIRAYGIAEVIQSKRFLRTLYGRSDMIICVSQRIAEMMRPAVKHGEKKTAILYNGYDCDEIRALSLQPCPEALSAACSPRLTAMGRIAPCKGFWHLVKALSVLKQKYPQIHLSIVGADQDGSDTGVYELTHKLGLDENVIFTGWQSNPYVFIADSDVYVMPSITEGFPNALVEAMACGKPVVSADCPSGPREILSEKSFDTVATQIERADYGILVPPLDGKPDYSTDIADCDRMLAEAIDMLLSDASLREEYARKAAERARVFSYDACKKNVVKIING